MADNAEFLEWLAAADVLKIRDGERRDAGWPCEFDLVSIASLQYPDTPTSGARERREQRQARDRLIEAMKASVAAGSLKAETRRKEIKKAAFHSPQPSAGLGSAAWLSRDFDRQDEQRAAHARRAAQSDVTIVADEVVTREAFAAWGGLPDQKQSELIRAWLRTTKHEPNTLASLTPMKRMANTQQIPDALRNFDALPDSAFVRLPVVAALFAFSPATVWRRVKSRSIPAPRKLSEAVTAWNVGEIRKARRPIW